MVDANKLERALDLVDRLHLEVSFNLAIQIAGRHDKLADLIEEAMAGGVSGELKDAMAGWLDNRNDAEASRAYGDKIRQLLPDAPDNAVIRGIGSLSKLLTKKSYWVFTGDGPAYDIAFGGNF